MKKGKKISLIASIAMVLSLMVMPVKVNAAEDYEAQTIDSNGQITNYSSYIKARDNGAGKTVKLLKDITYTSNNYIQDSMTIDLNGHIFEVPEVKNKNYAFSISKANTDSAPSVVFQDSCGGGMIKNLSKKDGTRGLSVMGIGTTVTVKDGVQISGMFGAQVYDGAKLIIENGNLQGTTAGVAMFGHKEVTESTSSLVVNGGTITGGYYGIAGNGDTNYIGSTSIVINGGIIKGTDTNDSTGIFHPQQGNLNVSGGSISGITGIEMRSGTVEVSGNSIITGTGEYSCTSNSSGSTTKGVGIAIAQHTTKNPVSLDIKGGKITGERSISQSNIQNNDSSSTDKITMKIDSGDFTGEVYSENNDKFINGGNYSKLPSYIADSVKDVIGISNTNGSTYAVGNETKDLIASVKAGDTVTVLKTSSSITVPNDVTVENKSDENIKVNGQTITTDQDIFVHNHRGTKVNKVEPTIEKVGNIAYWYCEDCGKYYSDEALTKEIQLEDTVIPKLQSIKTTIAAVINGKVVAGKDLVEMINASGEYKITESDLQGQIEKGQSLSKEEVAELDKVAKDLTTDEVTFKGYFLDKEGNKKLDETYKFNEDTTIYMVLEVKENTGATITPTPTPKPDQTTPTTKPTETTNKTEKPKTSDESNMSLYASFAGLALVGGMIIVLNKKREELLNK